MLLKINIIPLILQDVYTKAVRYDSGICKPDNHITAGSPSFTQWEYN